MHPVLEELRKIGVIPVIKIDDAEKAVPLAKALIAGSLPCAEVTFRTAQGEEAIRRIKKEAPGILLGAGTVLTVEQVDKAVTAGIAGFKVICNRHFPGDDRPMQIWERIAKAGKPILFHSGILYGSGPWSQYNRPVGFEPLFEIPHLRFALAHVSWPWCDENLAVYGYWQSRREHNTTSAEMFIDTTPGTPHIYRREVFKKIYTIGYDIENNLIFGTDCNSNYSSDYTKEILAMDKDALDNAGANAEQREKYYGKNFLRFLNG